MASQSALKQIPTGLIPGDMSLVAATATASLTAAESFNSLVRGVPVAAATYTTATATEILAAIGGDVKVGTSYEVIVLNASAGANTITVAGGTGVTVTGVATVAQNASKRFVCFVTGVDTPAITMYGLGSVAASAA